MKRWKIVFIIWVSIWLLFIARGFVKGEYKTFKALSFVGIEEKKAHILGKELKAFLDRCLSQIPEESTYKITGEVDPHNRYRLVYYLYPRTESENPDYLLNIYEGSKQYILKRVR